MPSASDWEFPRSAQPKPGDYQYDLEQALDAMVSVHAIIPGDGFTAETLGPSAAATAYSSATASY